MIGDVKKSAEQIMQKSLEALKVDLGIFKQDETTHSKTAFSCSTFGPLASIELANLRISFTDILCVYSAVTSRKKITRKKSKSKT